MNSFHSTAFKTYILLCFALGIAPLVWAHGEKEHSKPVQAQASPAQANSEVGPGDPLAEIGMAYDQKVKGIFEKKCSDCHGQAGPMPWYAALPPVQGLIERDIKEAKEHLDISQGFPFGGHGKPEEDLKAILETTQKGDMPPWLYLLAHGDKELTPEEQKQVQLWAEEALQRLQGAQTSSGSH